MHTTALLCCYYYQLKQYKIFMVLNIDVSCVTDVQNVSTVLDSTC